MYSNLKIAGIIPARYESSRFPGKPLAIIAGKTMIQRVYEQCIKAKSLETVIVATDNEKIYTEVEQFKGIAFKSIENHENGTSRCAETVDYLNRNSDNNIRYDYVINIQGDEPLINPEQIDELAALFQDKDVEIATLVKEERDLSLLQNSNIVKAILDGNHFAIDFRRTLDDSLLLSQIRNTGYFYRHVGIYGFKSGLLQKLVRLSPASNELQLHLEQLRWLENGYKIKTGITTYDSISVDTPEDLEKVVNIIAAQQPA